MDIYSVRHLTKFRYSHPVSESLMEARMHPRSDSNQRCLNFSFSVSPRCRVFSYRGHLGNTVHHFDIPGEHSQLIIIAESLIELDPLPELPPSISPRAWEEVDAIVSDGDFSEMLLPGEFAKPTAALRELARELEVGRQDDPLTFLRRLNTRVYDHFNYVPRSTRVNSPIEEAIRNRQGVCQDFAHIMLALVRLVGIPCRYVSGYLYHGDNDRDRSLSAATHAWIEAFLPGLGWVGFDPTNNLLANNRHIRTALGRDYADVPPTRGLYRGRTESDLYVAVKVSKYAEMPPLDRDMPVPEDWSILVERAQEPHEPLSPLLHSQQIQQQQQSKLGRGDG